MSQFAKPFHKYIAAVWLVATFAISCFGQAQNPETPDKYQWLEDVSGPRSMEWVEAENERSAKILESDPRFADYEATALKAFESPDRLQMPEIRGGEIYNTWQDADHVIGILRRTSVADYLSAQPHWHTVLDYDALAKQDNVKWVQEGLTCLYPGNELCLVELSAGGEDAEILREFNLKTGEFVAGGFTLPRAKQNVSWLDKDTLLVSSDWGPGSMTKSGYPFVAKSWKRGTPLSEAKEVFRGTPDDVDASAYVLNDGQGHQLTVFMRQLNAFASEISVMTKGGVQRVALPAKSAINGLMEGELIVTLNEDWKPGTEEAGFLKGALVALDLAAVKKDPQHLKPAAVFKPSETEFVQDAQITRDYLLVTTLKNVQGQAYIYARNDNGAWSRKTMDVPANVTVSIANTNTSDNRFFLRTTGFLTPSSLLFGDAGAGAVKPAKSVPPQFDGSQDVVEQLTAISKDGTKVPYFVVRPKDLKYDGTNPTLLTAYGGFQISETPSYRVDAGKLWLEHGGVFVLANIRGGGEFGPAWHDAGLKTNRQRIYDDFTAVGQDLITRKITSSRRLGIQGGSNGGLLMGVEMTQHPEMWNAIVIAVPLLDMLRFEQIAAGASWVGEYGSVSNPAERAFLASISPYNQLKPDVNYPEPLIFTTTKDDRVGPVHARKFAAKMEEFKKPFLYYEITEGGHGAGADLKERARTAAVIYTYLSRKLMN